MGTQPVETNLGGRQGRVLSVDDSPLARAVVRGYLHTGGYQVQEAESGPEALRHLATGGYDVVITDLHMPEVDGFALLSAVKREAPSTEVVFLTGAHDVNSTIRALRLGAHDYLTKPLTNADAVIFSVQRALEKRRLHEKNEQLLSQLEAQSQTDRLTGLANRRAFEESLARETALAQRHGHPLSVVLLAIDDLRDLNRAHGRQATDEILRSFARTLTGDLRAGDGLYRYGDEEFVAILPHAELLGAQGAADRLVAAVAATEVMIDATQVSIKVSAGVACLSLQDTDRSAFLGRATAALHKAKSRAARRGEPWQSPQAISDGEVASRARRRTD
ncbi:MAG TPA: diguanylate cyclase [Vicinamibacteria bacterium]|jgi:two-component system cell cycle response regulator|nr:diguanylate cyclase [Vicinamibacteria bacterium]